MNANIDQWIQKWLDPATGVMKLCHTCHAFAAGQLSGAFNLTVYLAILDTVIGGFLLYKLVFPWVNRMLIRYSEAMALRKFGKLRSKSLCPFAAKVKLYGGRIRKGQTIREGVVLMIPRLVEVTKLGKLRKLDGFVVELPANRFARDLDNLSESFNYLLGKR